MLQAVVVYILILLALGGLGHYVYRKLKALRKDKGNAGCDACPLKDSCAKKTEERKKAANSCCSSGSCCEG